MLFRSVCSINGFFHLLDITKAEVHDIHFLKNIKQQMSYCVLLGEKGYLSESTQNEFVSIGKH